MFRTALAVSILMSAPASLLAQSDEGEYWAQQAEADAKKAVADAKTQQAAREAAKKAAPSAPVKSFCDENEELNGPTGFLFELKGEDGLSMSFIYSACRADAAGAVRFYHADQAGYQLWVATDKGAKTSRLTIMESWAGSNPREAGRLGVKDNGALTSKKVVELGTVSVSDKRGRAKSIDRSGKATIQAARFTPPSNDEPVGCQ